MTKKFVIILFFLLLCLPLFCHNDKREIFIGGVLRASFDNKPIPLATIVVRNDKNKILENLSSDLNGKFYATLGSEYSSYYLEISIVGFQSYKTVVTLKEGKNYYNLGIITLKENSNLNPVVVIAPQLIRATSDGYLYDVSADSTAKNKKIVHLLEKLPFIELDQNNKPVYFGGSQKIAYMINGKGSILLNNTNLVMKMISGERIKSIELVPNPSAQYRNFDAVINIITKSSLFEGVLFSVENEVTYDNNIKVSPTISSALNWKNFSMVFTGTMSRSNSRGNYSKLLIIDSILPSGNIVPGSRSMSVNKSIQDDHRRGFDFSSTYKFTDKRDLSIRATFNQQYSESRSETEYSFESYPERDYTYNLNNEMIKKIFSGNIAYSDGKFRDKEFKINYNFSFMNNSNSSPIYEKFSRQYQNTLSSQFNIPIKNRKSLLLNIEYDNMYNKNEITSSVNDLSSNTQQSVVVGSGYSFRHKKSNFNINFNLKYYDNRGYTNSYSSTPLVKYNLLSLNPSFSYSIILNNQSNISLKISKSVRNPYIFQLSTYEDDSDPKNITKGNPLLKPEKTISSNASYMKQGFRFTSSLLLSYSFFADAIERVSYYKEGVITNTYGNISSKNNITIRITERIKINRKLDLSSSVTYTNLFYSNNDYNSHDLYSLSLSCKYKLFKRSSILLTTGFSPSSLDESAVQDRKLYYKFSNMLTISGYSKNMKFSYLVVLLNLHELNRVEESLKTFNDYRFYTKSNRPGLMGSFKLSYSFGKIKKPMVLSE